jgi:heterodisulfide reductase subunit C
MSIEKGTGLPKIVSFSAYGDSFMELGVGSIPKTFFDIMVKDVGSDYLTLRLEIEDIRDELGLGSYILPEDAINEVEAILDKSGFKVRLERIKSCEK